MLTEIWNTTNGQARSLARLIEPTKTNDVYALSCSLTIFTQSWQNSRWPVPEMIRTRANVGSDGIVKADLASANGPEDSLTTVVDKSLHILDKFSLACVSSFRRGVARNKNPFLRPGGQSRAPVIQCHSGDSSRQTDKRCGCHSDAQNKWWLVSRTSGPVGVYPLCPQTLITVHAA